MPENFNQFWERYNIKLQRAYLPAERKMLRSSAISSANEPVLRNQLNTVNSQIIAASLQLVQDHKANPTVFALPVGDNAIFRQKKTSQPTIDSEDRLFEIPDPFKQIWFFDSGKQDTERKLFLATLRTSCT